jgi:hypothetical protein
MRVPNLSRSVQHLAVERELRMREWMPSIVPGAPEQNYYIVINNFRDGPSFLETDLDRADLETTITNLMAGEYSDPLRVIMFNPEANRSEDVSHAVTTEVLRRLALEGREVPPRLEEFIDSHTGPDRQLTLRLGSPVLSYDLIEKFR